MNEYKHFGCIIRKPENAKLSRSNYASITISTRKNSFRDVGIYSIGKKGRFSSMEEALSYFFETEGNDLIESYVERLLEYEKGLKTYKKILHDIDTYPDIAEKYYLEYRKSKLNFILYAQRNYIVQCFINNDFHKLIYKSRENEGFYNRWIDIFSNVSYEENDFKKEFPKYRKDVRECWNELQNQLNKMKADTVEEIIAKNKYFCLQWGHILIKKVVIYEKNIEEVKKFWDIIQEKIQKLDEEVLNSIEDAIQSGYLKPSCSILLRSPHLPRTSHKNPLDFTLLEIKQMVQEDHFPYRTDEVCKELQKKALYNFDLNMAFYKKLDKNKFNEEIENFLSTHPEFVSITDLNNYKGVAGIYIMVLDEYKQVYIGVTNSKTGIKGRIQAHWNTTKTLDRLIFGGVDRSILSIDSFRHLDTTRIFVCTNVNEKDLYSKEYDLIENAFSPEFLTNRSIGGELTFCEAMNSQKVRNLL